MLYPLSYGSERSSHLRVRLAQQASATRSQVQTPARLREVEDHTAVCPAHEGRDSRHKLPVQVSGRDNIPTNTKAGVVDLTLTEAEGNGTVLLFACEHIKPTLTDLQPRRDRLPEGLT